MRIWHERIIPYLCDMHLQTMYREGCQIYEIVTCEKVTVGGKQYRAVCNRCGGTNPGQSKCPACGKRLDGYFYHPAVREWWFHSWRLHNLLSDIAVEYPHTIKQKLPEFVKVPVWYGQKQQYWQTYEQQLAILEEKRQRIKRCRCEVGE